MNKVVIAGILIILLIEISSASYISGDIYIYEDGFSRFEVESDIPLKKK